MEFFKRLKSFNEILISKNINATIFNFFQQLLLGDTDEPSGQQVAIATMGYASKPVDESQHFGSFINH